MVELSNLDIQAEQIARSIHTIYEKYALDHIPARPSRVIWEKLPIENKALMMAVVKTLIINGTIEPGEAITTE